MFESISGVREIITELVRRVGLVITIEQDIYMLEIAIDNSINMTILECNVRPRISREEILQMIEDDVESLTKEEIIVYLRMTIWILNKVRITGEMTNETFSYGSVSNIDATSLLTLCPYSKLYCWEQWIREEVFLPSAQSLQLHHLYFGMDFLEEHKAEVEKAVYFKMADLMNADVDVIFYDTTSLHFEVDEEDVAELRKQGRAYEPLRKRGHSKNGRGDAPQIVVGLAVTRDGLPVRSWVFSGETNDVTTVEKIKKDLRGWRLGRCIFVGDAGMNSKDNRRMLALGNGKYILGARMRAGDEVTHDVLARAGRFKDVKDNLRVKEVLVGDGERRQRYVVCHNPQEETRQREHRDKVITELEAELASMRQPATGRGHSKRACELLTSGRYGKYLRQAANGDLRLDRTAIQEAERYDGKWVVTSNDDTLTAEDLALGYKQLLRVEQCWRQMKSGLRMRPVFHFRPWRIQAHVTLSVLALLLERIAEIRTGETWRNLLAQLETIKVVEYDRGEARIRQTTEVRPEALAILKKLHVPPPPKLHTVEVAPDESAPDLA